MLSDGVAGFSATICSRSAAPLSRRETVILSSEQRFRSSEALEKGGCSCRSPLASASESRRFRLAPSSGWFCRGDRPDLGYYWLPPGDSQHVLLVASDTRVGRILFYIAGWRVLESPDYGLLRGQWASNPSSSALLARLDERRNTNVRYRFGSRPRPPLTL